MSRKHTQSNPVHTCPECGGDAARTRDRYPFTTHGSRLHVWVVYGILLASYIGIAIAGAQWHTFNTGPRQVAGHLQTSFQPNQSIVVRGQVTDTYRKLADLNEALKGDKQLFDTFIAELQEACEPFEYFGTRVTPQRIRLDLESPEVEESSVRNYRFLGHLLGTNSWQVYETAAKQVPVQPRQGTPERTQIHWWPSLHIQIDTVLGEHGRTYSISYINIISLIVLAGLLTQASVLLLSRSGIRIAKRASFQFGLIAAILLVFAIGAFTDPFVQEDDAPRYYSPIVSGAWHNTESVRSKIDDPTQAQTILQEFIGPNNFDHYDPSLAVTIAREINTNATNTTETPTLRTSSGFRLQLPGVGQLLSYQHINYDQNQAQPIQTRSWWNDFLDHGWLIFSRSTQRDGYHARINILAATLPLASPWLLWLVLSRIHRLRTWRVQRKRVNRGQCIYCGYRATDEALAARWEESPSPP